MNDRSRAWAWCFGCGLTQTSGRDIVYPSLAICSTCHFTFYKR